MRKKLLSITGVLSAFLLFLGLLWLAVKLKESKPDFAGSTAQDFSQQMVTSPASVGHPPESSSSEPGSSIERFSGKKEIHPGTKNLPTASEDDQGFGSKQPSQRAHSSLRTAVNSFLQKFLKLDAMPLILTAPGTKDSGKKENLTPDVSRWIGTKQFGFEFESIPSASDWKITEQSRGMRFSAKEFSTLMKTAEQSENVSIFLKAENNWAEAELFFAAIAKDSHASYSQQLSDHWGVAETLAQKMGQQLSLKNMRLFQKETKFLPNTKFLQIKISGLDEKRNMRFKGKLFFFQTPTHFVGALLMPSRMPQNFNFARVERMLTEMFQKMVFSSSVARFARIVRSEPIQKGSEPIDSGKPIDDRKVIPEPIESSRGRYGRPPPLVTSKRAVAGSAPSKMQNAKKAWESSSENVSVASEELDPALSLKTPGFETRFVLCATCAGKSRCPNPECDGGFVLCELCKADPPPKCRKCKGTGLRRVDNPFTRTETWGYCDRCYGTGKKICRNDCRGGKLKCSICQGTGLCPECKGRGFASR